MPHSRIALGMHNVHARLVKADFRKGLDRQAFACDAATVLGDVNHVHSFREGNGRTQFQFLKQLGGRAGIRINYSIAANKADYAPMAKAIAAAIDPSLEKRQDRSRGKDKGGRER